MRWVAPGLLFLSIAISACGDAHKGPGDAGDAAADALVNAANNPFPCLDPLPDESSLPGVVRCANGMRIRPRLSECAPSAIPSNDECLRASDCGENRPCYCDAPDVAGGNYCGAPPADTDCLSDLDCDYGFHCVIYSAGFSDWVRLRQRCQRPIDECAVETDCASSDYDAGLGYYGPVCQDDAQGRVCCDPSNDWSCIRGQVNTEVDAAIAAPVDAGVGNDICPAVGRPPDGTPCTLAGALCYYSGEGNGRLLFTCASGNCPDAPCNALFTECEGRGGFQHWDSANCEGGI